MKSMSIVDELIASLRADAPVRRMQIAPFWTAVLADRIQGRGSR